MTTHTAIDSTHDIAAKESKVQLGFWFYLMTDIMLFASLFATYMILRHGTNGGPSSNELFEPSYALAETLILLVSSFTCGLAYLAVKAGKRRDTLLLLGTTIVLGIAFISLELYEFGSFIVEGNSWARSGFLSGFFTLVGVHGLHILVGLIWAIAFGGYISDHKQINANTVRKFGLFALFWHFLDLVWIFIFTVVYLLGVIA